MNKSSSLLAITDFTYIQVLPDEENISDIIKFGGVPEHGIEQELIFHNEGSPYMIENKEIVDIDNSYILRFPDINGIKQFHFMSKEYFELLFKG